MMKDLKLGAKVMAAALIASAGFVSSAQAQTTTLRFSHWVPTTHPVHNGIVAWGKAVEDASNGSLKVQIFPAQQLGQAKDHYDMAKDGIVDVTFVSPGYSSGRFPILGASELPFMISNAKKGAVALNEWYDQHKDHEMGDVMQCFVLTHAPGQFHAKKKISEPSDLKGMNIRSGNAVMAKWMFELGANNVQVSAAEVREVVERGTADAITFLWNSVVLYGLDRTLKFHMDESLYVTTFAVIMNKGAYNKLNAEQKKVIDDQCSPAAAERMATVWSDWELAGRDVLLKRPDHTLYKLSDAQRDAWRNSAKPLEQQWANDVKSKAPSAEPESMLADLKKRLQALGAGG